MTNDNTLLAKKELFEYIERQVSNWNIPEDEIETTGKTIYDLANVFSQIDL